MPTKYLVLFFLCLSVLDVLSLAPLPPQESSDSSDETPEPTELFATASSDVMELFFSDDLLMTSSMSFSFGPAPTVSPSPEFITPSAVSLPFSFVSDGVVSTDLFPLFPSVSPLPGLCADGDVRLNPMINLGDVVIGVLEGCIFNLFFSFCDDGTLDEANSQILATESCRILGFTGGRILGPRMDLRGDSFLVFTNFMCEQPFVAFVESCSLDFSFDPSCLNHSRDIILECNTAIFPSIPLFSSILVSPSVASEVFSSNPLIFPSAMETMQSSSPGLFAEMSSDLLFSSSVMEEASFLFSPSSSIMVPFSLFFTIPSSSLTAEETSSFILPSPSVSLADNIFSSVGVSSSPVVDDFSSIIFPSIPIESTVLQMSPSPTMDIFPSPSSTMDIFLSSTPVVLGSPLSSPVSFSSLSVVESSPVVGGPPFVSSSPIVTESFSIAPSVTEIFSFDSIFPSVSSQEISSPVFPQITLSVSISISPSPSPSPSTTMPVSTLIVSDFTVTSTVTTTPVPPSPPPPSPSPSPPVLPFLELDGEISPVSTLPTNEESDQSELVDTNQVLIIGDNIFREIYVGDNGVISFNSPFEFYEPARFPFSNERVTERMTSEQEPVNVLAPYWGDVDNRVEGSINYQIYTTNTMAEQDRLYTINRFIQVSQEVEFNGTWALVVDWNAVHPFDHQEFVSFTSRFEGRTADFLNSTNTFQAIIITDTVNTYVIYTYRCGDLQWTGPIGGTVHAVIGYDIQGISPVNEDLSGSEFVNVIACNNRAAGSLFVNVVYRFAANPGLPYIQCLDARNRDEMLFGSVVATNPITCPCSRIQAILDRRFFRSLVQVSFNPFSVRICYSPVFSFGRSVLCCYGFSFFSSLIESGPFISTSIIFNPFFQRGSFFGNDVEFHRLCCIEGNFCNNFVERRSSATCIGYRRPFFTWFWGDPHFRTLDGRRYTFNGLGEYIMIDANGTFQLQARTAIAGNSTATLFSAFAAGDTGRERVQIETDANKMEMIIKLDNVDISANLTNTNDTYMGMTVMLSRSTEDTVAATFQSSISAEFTLRAGALSVVSKVPPEFNGTLTGLLGNFDGDETNDFIYRNLSVASNDISDREKHAVAQTWQISQDESLFFYEDGQNVSTFSDPEFIPTFLDEIDNETRAQAVEVCNGIENIECVFDFLQTNDMALASSTLDTNNQNLNEEEAIANFPPMIEGPDTLRFDINVPAIYTVNITDPGDTFTVDIVGVAGVLPMFTFTEGPSGVYTLNITLRSVQSFTFMIVANDSSGVTNSIMPQLEICGCQNGGNCTLNGIIDLSANPLILACRCPEAWTGELCTEDFDGCSEVSCFLNAVCTDVQAPGIGATCPPCPTGYEGEGQKCFDVDECANPTLDTCEQICINTQGSFECACETGFALAEDGRLCEDVDECLNNEHDCDHTCTNTFGTFNCSCQLGFLLDSDGRSCDPDANSTCPDDNPCEQLCGVRTEVGGSGSGVEDISEIVCSCLRGFVGSIPDSINCTNINECAQNFTNPCEQNCFDTEGSFFCNCSEGFEQNGFRCDDINECSDPAACGALQECNNTEGSFSCICQAGYQMNNVTQECEDVNECTSDEGSPCAQICTNNNGSFVCSCRAGFESMGFSCMDIDECVGSPPPCPFGQLCNNTEGSHVCICPMGSIMNADGMCEQVIEITTTSPLLVSSTLLVPSVSMSQSTTTSATQTPLPVEMMNIVQLTLVNFSVNRFNDTARLRFRMVVASIINSYCSDDPGRCATVDLSGKRQTVMVTADDVVITSVTPSEDGLIVQFFVRGNIETVVSAETVVAALMNQSEQLMDADFIVMDILIPNAPTEDDGLSDGAIAGIVIAVIIGAALLVVFVILVFYFCCWRQRSSGRYAFVEKGPGAAKDDFTTIKNIYYEPGAPTTPDDDGSVHSMTLNFKEPSSSEEESDDDSKNEKAKLDDSEETRL